MHDPRVGRFFAIDPLTSKYPHYTPYSFAGNKVIAFTELEGQEEFDIKTLTERMGKVLIKFQTKANIIAKEDPEKLKKYQTAINGYKQSLENFLNNDRLLSAYSLLRYGEGEGGVEFYNLDLLKDSHEFGIGYKAASGKIEKRAEMFLNGKFKSNYTEYSTKGQSIFSLGSDTGTALGSFALKFNVGMKTVRDGDEVLVKGTVRFTLADTYRWDAGRTAGYAYLGYGDHQDMYSLLDLGAKEYSIRTYFTSKFTFKNAVFSFNRFDITETEDLENDCDNELYPEISSGKGYSLEPGGEKGDFRPQN